MAAYGSLVSFARQLGFSDAAQLLEQTLNEEKAADAKLDADCGDFGKSTG